jgi:hypothetical protein
VSLSVKLASGEIYDVVFFVVADPRRDFAVLRIPADRTPHLNIERSRSASMGDRVYVMGNPLGLEATFSDGLVSSLRVLDGTELVQITAPISAGSSGGPVMNDAGRVIGIATASFEAGQNLNLAVPARYVDALLRVEQRPQPFTGGLVPSRRLAAEPDRTSLSSAGYVPVRDPTGMYEIILQGEPSGHTVVVPSDARYMAMSWYSGSFGGVSPLTLTADGRVAVEIGVALEGGFVSAESIILDIPGSEPKRNDPFVRLDASRAAISSPYGVYRVEGRGQYIDSSSDPVGWSGYVAILPTDLQLVETGGQLAMLYFDLRNVRGGSRQFTTRAYLFVREGRFDVVPMEWDRADKPSTDSITLDVRAGQVDVVVMKQHQRRADRFLDNRLTLRGSKVR